MRCFQMDILLLFPTQTAHSYAYMLLGTLEVLAVARASRKEVLVAAALFLGIWEVKLGSVIVHQE